MFTPTNQQSGLPRVAKTKYILSRYGFRIKLFCDLVAAEGNLARQRQKEGFCVVVFLHLPFPPVSALHTIREYTCDDTLP
jgi:hypothetical protein